MSLREEIAHQLYLYRLKCDIAFSEREDGVTTQDEYASAIVRQAEINTEAILATISKHLPDIEKHVCRFNDGEQTCDCFKECLDEVNKLLTTNKKEEV